MIGLSNSMGHNGGLAHPSNNSYQGGQSERHIEPEALPIAVRVYPVGGKEKLERDWECPDGMLVFDTETRIDHTQRLTFGSYRFLVAGRCLEEGLFYADDLPQIDRQILDRYVAGYEGGKLALLTREAFLRKIFRDVYKNRCLLVAFNFPFDISRLAWTFAPARRQPFTGGFALQLWSYFANGQELEDRYRPNISIKQIDSKRALKGFTGRKKTDKEDRIPDDSETGEPEEGYVFRGNFLDLRTLAFALTDRGHTLESACKAFGVEHGKQHISQHGVVTKEYIDYNRRDVLSTSELAVKLLQEYSKHPIKLQITKAYSPAAIGKAYLHAMGIKPILVRQPDFPKEYLGYAATAFFGGRTSAHIRKIAVPVVYTDFTSMYPTVNSLMDLWRFVTARKIKVIEHCQAEIEIFLKKLIGGGFSELFNQETWKELTAFTKIIPNGEILPSRGQYNSESHDWQVAVNYLYADAGNSDNQALWFSLPDIIASVILMGRVPKIIDAFRLEPKGKLKSLKPTKLLGSIDIHPANEDFFRVVIEQRKSLASRADISEVEKQRLDKALKVLANAASYGIYAEMHRQESNEKVMTTYDGIDSEPINRAIQHPDEPGEYCFTPLASLITGAARLMLALLEHSVSKLGGTYVMEDTDSMAIVATEHRGIIPCPGGRVRTADGREGINALSWKQVDQISEQFSALNPYDRIAVPGSILKLEDDNYRNPKTKDQRQIYCFAISAKRYTLFLYADDGTPVLLREGENNEKDGWSEHGLGHLLNPTDPESDDRDWISQIWNNIVFRALGSPTRKLAFLNSPAVGRVTIGSPAIMNRLKNLNDGKKYPDRIKPFNFLLTSHVMPFGHPAGADPERFQLIAPYESDSRKWLKMKWINQYSGELYGISTAGHYVSRQTARVKTYGDVLCEYEFHAESKCADSNGKVCDKETIGLLQRRHIRIEKITYIGKESNKIEDVQSALVHAAQEAYTEYPNPKRDEWATKILPALKKPPLEQVVKMCDGKFSRRAIIDWRAGRSRPHQKNESLVANNLRKLGLI